MHLTPAIRNRALSLLLLPFGVLSAPTLPEGHLAPLASSSGDVVPDSYIVVLKKDVNVLSASAHQAWIQSLHDNHQTELRKRGSANFLQGVRHTYRISDDFVGYSGYFHDEVVEQIRRHPDVSDITDRDDPYIYTDHVFYRSNLSREMPLYEQR
jgi:cerevisin